MNKLYELARDSEEQRLKEIISGMHSRGIPHEKICDYLVRVANRYLAEMGFDKNGMPRKNRNEQSSFHATFSNEKDIGELGRGEFVKI